MAFIVPPGRSRGTPRRSDVTRNRDLREGGLPVSKWEFDDVPRFYARIVKYRSQGDSYDVRSLGLCGLVAPGKYLSEIPRKVEDPGTQAPLPLGTIVVIDNIGFPQITGVLPLDTDAATIAGSTNVPNLGVDTSETSTERASSAFYGRPIANGLLPGDFIRKSPDGNYLAILRKGINWLFANKNTQIIMSRIGDFIGVYSKEFVHRSGIGELRIGQQDGEGFLQFDAGFDLLNDVAYKSNRYPLSVGLGKAAKQQGGQDCIACLVVKNPDTKGPVAGIYFTNKGRIKMLGHAGFEMVSANKGPVQEEYGGDKRTRIVGNQGEFVGRSRFKTIEQEDNRSVGSNYNLDVGNDFNCTIQRNKYQNILGNYSLTVRGGSALPSLPTVKGYEIQVLNNSFVIEVGRTPPATATIPLEMGFYMHQGELILGENPLFPAKTCTVSINTLKPGMIHLGGNLKSPTTNAPALHNELTTWLTDLLKAFDTHTHPTAWGPSGVPIKPASPTLAPKIPTLRSKFVGIRA